MSENTTTLPYSTTEDVESAARFIAALIQSSTVVFHSVVVKDKMVITYTGGY